MKIHHRLALLLLTAGLAACGSSDLGGSKGDPLPSTGVVITSEPITAPTTADKATVGFRVIFPEPAGAVKAALNPAMTRVTITTYGACGVDSLELSPTVTSGVMNLKAGECTFAAVAYDAANEQIESATTKGVLLAGANNVSLTFLGGPWLFVDPASNAKAPMTLVGGEVLSGINISPTNGALITRWFGPDSGGDGPTSDDLLGGVLTTPPLLRATGTFSGGTGSGANLVRLVGAMSNLTNWEGTFTTGQRVIQILGTYKYPTTYNPTSYQDYLTSKVLDGTTLEGNIAEFTVDSTTVGTPYGTCTPATTAAAQTAAQTAALSTAQTLTGTVTASWTQCVNNQNQDVTHTYSNVTIHPFRAESSFADPASAMQVELNKGIANYKKVLETEDAVNGLDLILLRQAAGQFVTAVNLAGETLSNTADTARFFGAISRLASLGVDTVADGSLDGLNDFNDVLDALGVPADATSRDWSNLIKTPETCVDVVGPYYTYQDCTPNLPATAPRSGEILTLLDNKINTQLDLAIADLSRISAGFTYNFIETSGATTNFDYGDVLALTAIAHGIKAELAIDMAYDLDLDIDATINGSGPASVQQFLIDNPTLGDLAPLYATELLQAKTDLQTALTTMQSAIDVIEAEGTGVAQESEFVSFYHTDYQCIPNQTGIPPYCTWTEIDNTAQDLANFRDAIAKALIGLNGPVTVDDNDTPAITGDDTIIDPNKFFAGISFRSLLPTFSGDDATSLFPNPTMNGVLVQTPGFNVNQDFDGNGVADLVEDANFYAALLKDKAYALTGYSGGVYLKGYNVYWSSFRFNSNGTVAADWNYYNYSVYPYETISGTATGTWSILSTGELQIDFSANSPLNLASIVAELDDPVDAQISPIYFATDMSFTYSDPSQPIDRNYMWWNEKGSVSVIIR